MRIKEWIFVIFWLSAGISAQAQNEFISPLKIPVSLSANFGELRTDHYHSGIDIKTQGVTGKEVVASADGYVYLILVSPVGFGKAIYIRHPFGLSTVYAHLDGYSPEIEEYVKLQQYRLKTFAITITPPENRLPVKKGQLIGYSGNTGGSTGPHLHFEVRKSDGEKPLDPLKYNIGVTDNQKPVIHRLVVYPASKNTIINGSRSKLLLNISGSNGCFELPAENDISIYGTAGFGISGYDNINDTPGTFGLSAIDLYVDSLLWFSYKIDEFSFFETRYINAHIDYEAKIRSNLEIERLFVLPNDKLSLYKSYMNNGFFEFTDNKPHEIKIIAMDTRGNKSNLIFNIKPGNPAIQINNTNKSDSSKKVMPHGNENIFAADGIRLVIPPDALYDTINFTYSVTESNGNLFSPIYRLHNIYSPLHKAAKLSIKPRVIPVGRSSRLIIVQVDDKGTHTSVGGSFAEGIISADIRAFGSYAVSADTIPPVINPNGLTEGADLSEKSSVRLKITDDLSGIKSYTGLIDGKWALFEFDAKNNLLFYKFDSSRITKGIKHNLEITVTDNCSNSATLKLNFTW